MGQFIEDVKNNLAGLAYILEEKNIYQEAEDEERPEWQKELDGDTVMFDCDAIDCKFWNEGFKSNCMLRSVEIDAQHGCAQFQPKDEGEDNEDQI